MTKRENNINEINQKECLRLDNIRVLRVGENDSYMITMPGVDEENNITRVLLSSRETEASTIEECMQESLEIGIRCITDYMMSDHIELYDSVLDDGDYLCCTQMLEGIERHLNGAHKKYKTLMLKNKN